MPTLFRITTRRNGCQTKIAGNVRATEGATYRPDDAAVRECLPAYWRKAFDRSSWRPLHMHSYRQLFGARGQYLGVVYAEPYDFN